MITKNNQLNKLAGVILSVAVITACSSDNSGVSLNKGKASSGDADFSKFVSIGDSLTAGYADGALYLLGQTNSYPATLAKQFADADGVAVAFEQPLVGDNQGGLLAGGVILPHPVTGDNLFENRLVLNTNPDPTVEGERPSPERLAGAATTEVIGSGLNGMSFNNMGVPGAKSFHLLAPGFGSPAGLGTVPPTANPYFVRFTSDITSATVTVMGDVASQIPSFFTLWVGNNDVLGFATSGGDDSNPVTPAATFDGAYAGIIGTIAAANSSAKGVLINIPDVSTIPFFTTVPFNAIPLDQTTADALNSNPNFIAYNAGVAMALAANPDEVAQRTITFVAGQNAALITDEDLTDLTAAGLPSMRQATAADLILLPTSALLGVEATDGDPATAQGVTQPLADADVLTATEIQQIDTARLAFNATIKAAADADPNLAFFDVAAIMSDLQASNIDFGTGSVSSTFATGGAFSLDGVHPTGRGYAVIANAIIDVINTEFNANVHKVDPAKFPTIFLK